MSALMLFSLASCGNDAVSDAVIDTVADALIDAIEDSSASTLPLEGEEVLYAELPGDSSYQSSPEYATEEVLPTQSSPEFATEEVIPSHSQPSLSPEEYPILPEPSYTSHTASSPPVEEGVYYYDLENVVLYLEYYGCLPDNYITKNQARELGWSGGTPERYLEGSAIGGDSFGNREKLLPVEKGRSYTECDLNTNGSDSRGAERLVFSNDGLYFHTEDHYERFTQYTVTDDWQVIPW